MFRAHEFTFQLRGLNVLLTLNVQTTLHVSGKNARILASPQLVESMLNAGFRGTEQSVYADQGMRVIPIASVKNVRTFYCASMSQSFSGFSPLLFV